MSNQDTQKTTLPDELSEPAGPEDAAEPWQRVARAASVLQADTMVRTVLEALAEALIVVDGDGLIVFVNRRMEEMFGYHRDEVVGQPLSLFLPDQVAEIHAQHLSGYFRKPRMRPMGQRLELIGKRKDGTSLPVDISLSPLDTEAGPLALAFITDVTLRKQTERALQRRNEELDAFAHTVAHELNSSLGLLIGFSEFLVEAHETLPPQERHTYLTMIARNGHRMNKLIDELLLFSSIRKEDVAVSPLDMALVVGEALSRLAHLIGDYQAEIILPDSYPQAMGYAPWIEKVWFNYISNAMKYGGTPPRVELGADVQDDGNVKFWVRDNGAGLTKEQQRQLFRPWTRLDSSIGEGHGLGLSIVERILAKLNGHVGVESKVGKGSLFYFTLPGVK
ncbi:MAG: PAS domain S-box protein [Anaerolineales bacterium]|nr:MAG: PAS domain S-box protein [Anaerolineales bacterium]